MFLYNSHNFLPMKRYFEETSTLNPYKRHRFIKKKSPDVFYCLPFPCPMTNPITSVSAQDPLSYMSPDPRIRQLYKCTYCKVVEHEQAVVFVLVSGYTCDTCGLSLPEYYTMCSNCYELFFPRFTCQSCLAGTILGLIQ